MTDAAWKPDPTGRHELRYWNGTQWTEHVSDLGAQAVDGDLTPAAPSTTPQLRSGPRVDRSKARVPVWGWILIAFGLLVVAGVVVVAAAVNEVADDNASHAISPEQFDSVRLGITRAELEDQLGKAPESAQEFVHQGILTKEQVSSGCVYYNDSRSTFGGSSYQFCFDGGELTSKNSYG